jgi:hypothetical protein
MAMLDSCGIKRSANLASLARRPNDNYFLSICSNYRTASSAHEGFSWGANQAKITRHESAKHLRRRGHGGMNCRVAREANTSVCRKEAPRQMATTDEKGKWPAILTACQTCRRCRDWTLISVAIVLGKTMTSKGPPRNPILGGVFT